MGITPALPLTATTRAMSLALLQGYSSEEQDDEEAAVEQQLGYDYEDSDDGRNNGHLVNRFKPFFNPNPASSSSLPSTFDAFSEISGPPQFLNNCVEEGKKDTEVKGGALVAIKITRIRRIFLLVQ